MPPQNARPFFIPSARRGINNKKDCSTAFEEQHCAELTAYRAAAAYFKANNITKLPSPKKLEAEYHANNEKQEVPACWVFVKQFSRNDTATACQDWLRVPG
ncbi:hypothetical protein CGS50_010860 [Faecalibacterium prausnitzii]|uniref:Uncharacterized protein n=1 Tax=Faecalibacterium prausnitzii TaxID=853 RepID=A0A2J4JM21_9FIRM|nr:hypothetical protein CGS50_010860 [Faecalibacterium prausnitzii]